MFPILGERRITKLKPIVDLSYYFDRSVRLDTYVKGKKW